MWALENAITGLRANACDHLSVPLADVVGEMEDNPATPLLPTGDDVLKVWPSTSRETV